MTLPNLTNEDRRYGAEKSLQVRQGRASVKLAILAGALSLNEALSVEAVQGMKVSKLLQALPNVGPSRAKSYLVAAGIREDASVRSIGSLQRERLLRVFGN